jgi:hypothetical protein
MLLQADVQVCDVAFPSLYLVTLDKASFYGLLGWSKLE